MPIARMLHAIHVTRDVTFLDMLQRQRFADPLEYKAFEAISRCPNPGSPVNSYPPPPDLP